MLNLCYTNKRDGGDKVTLFTEKKPKNEILSVQSIFAEHKRLKWLKHRELVVDLSPVCKSIGCLTQQNRGTLQTCNIKRQNVATHCWALSTKLAGHSYDDLKDWKHCQTKRGYSSVGPFSRRL